MELRYVIGSQLFACDCPAGYEGENCESKVCKTLNCSQLCVPRANKGYQCQCYSGYRLGVDNRTCLPHGRIRYLGSIKLKEPPFDPSRANKSSAQYLQLKGKIISELQSLLRKRVEETRNLTILNFHPGGVVEFHFFGNPRESDVARRLLMDSVAKGLIGETSVFTDFIRFEREPALNLQEVYIKQGPVRLSGGDMSIACVAMGTSQLQFQWFKDGYPINNGTSNQHIWMGNVPKNTRDQYTGVLMIDKLVPQDTGTFTCQVSDWGEVQHRSVSLRVVSPPKVHLTPLSRTLEEKESLTLVCVSKEDTNGTFGYSWLKNGQILNPSEGQEEVEDLFPTGSRVKILQAGMTAIYTCIVSNRAGQNKKQSHITVINPVIYPVCPSMTSFNVTWWTTAVNSEDIRDCPGDSLGSVHRLCSSRGQQHLWEEPDFSQCVSQDMMNIINNFENLKLGYMATDVSTELWRTLTLLKERSQGMFPGEGKPILDLLADLSAYQVKYPPQSKQIHLENLQVMLDVLALLLDSSRAINAPQKAIQLQSLVQREASHLAALLEVNSTRVEIRPPFVLELTKVPSSGLHTLTFPSRSSVNTPTSNWLTDYLVVTLDDKESTTNMLKENLAIEVAIVFYKNLSALLPKRYTAKYEGGPQVEFVVDSTIVSVSGKKSGQDLGVARQNGSAQVTIAFSKKNARGNTTGWNVTCGMANYFDNLYIKPHWLMSACSISDKNNFTFCHCDQFGTYAVLLLSYNISKEEHFGLYFDFIVTICSIVCLGFLCASIFLLTICFRKVQRGILVLKLQVCFGLASTVATFLGASRISLRVEWYPFVATALEFFFLLPYSTQVCLELMVYMEVANSYHVQNVRTKVVLISWGIPILVTGATLAAQSETGFKFTVWWIQIGDIYFFGFVITSVILSLLYITLYLIVSAEVRHNKFDEASKGKFAIHSHVLQRSLLVQLLVVTISVAEILYSNSDDVSMRHFFSASTATTGVMVFLLYGLDESFCPCNRRGQKLKDSADEGKLDRADRIFIKGDPAEECLMQNNVFGSARERIKQEKVKQILRSAEDLQPKKLDDLPDVASMQTTVSCLSGQMAPPNKNILSTYHISGSDIMEMIPLTTTKEECQLAEEIDVLPVIEGLSSDQPQRTRSAVLVSYEGSPKKFSGQSDGKERTFTGTPLGTVMELPVEEELVSSMQKKYPPALKPKPGYCYSTDAYSHPSSLKTSSLLKNKPLASFHQYPKVLPPVPIRTTPSRTASGQSSTSHHVTFGPVTSMPLEKEYEGAGGCTFAAAPDGSVDLPPPPKFKDPSPTPSQLTVPSIRGRHFPVRLKLDGIVSPMDTGSTLDILAEESDCPSRDASSPDSHDTAV